MLISSSLGGADRTCVGIFSLTGGLIKSDGQAPKMWVIYLCRIQNVWYFACALKFAETAKLECAISDKCWPSRKNIQKKYHSFCFLPLGLKNVTAT